jgi:hypothetical protein
VSDFGTFKAAPTTSVTVLETVRASAEKGSEGSLSAVLLSYLDSCFSASRRWQETVGGLMTYGLRSAMAKEPASNRTLAAGEQSTAFECLTLQAAGREGFREQR